MQTAMPPAQVADAVFQAIREERFYILTHPEGKNWIRTRMEDIFEERNPTPPGYSAEPAVAADSAGITAFRDMFPPGPLLNLVVTPCIKAMSNPHDEIVSFLPEQSFRMQVERKFEELKRKLADLLPTADIQHVGSTAIPGSLTKGDLDIQVRVSSSDYAAAKERLRRIFEVNVGGFSEEDAVSFEDYSCEPPTGIHLTVIGGSSDIQWRFRDLLASSKSLQREYDELKRRFEGKSMAKYREAKEAFVMRVGVTR
jgi:GrpB-like predicted nucleotidyltransferase (UPF0157 family)